MCEQCTRRQFFERNALGGMVLAGAAVAYARAADTRPAAPRGKSRICVLFTGDPQPGDRNWGADDGQIAAVKARLAEAEQRLGDVELFYGVSHTPDETRAVLAEAGPDVPVLAMNVQNFSMRGAVQPVLDEGRAMAVFAAGTALSPRAKARRKRRGWRRKTA